MPVILGQATPGIDAVGTDAFTAALIQAAGLLLLIRWLDVWEREPLRLLVLLALWGAVGAGALAVVGNGLVDSLLSPDVSLVYGAAISAPLVEETAKGLALVAVVLGSPWIGRRLGRPSEFDGVTDGIVLGAAVGLGFAFSENNFYFLQQESLAEGARVLELREGFLNLNTLSHAVYTSAFGAGLGLGMWSPRRVARIGFPLAGLAVGMFLHALHNGLESVLLVRQFGFDATVDAFAGRPVSPELIAASEAIQATLTVLDYALVAAFFAVLVAWVLHQRQILRHELSDEVGRGTISAEDCGMVPRYGSRVAAYARLIAAGRWQRLAVLRQTHESIADLAFAKWRARATGSGAPEVDLSRARMVDLRRRLEETP